MNRELFFAIIVFLFFETLAYVNTFVWDWVCVIIGLVLILLWIILTMRKYSPVRISKYTDIMLKLEIRERWFNYIFIPVFFYLCLSFLIIFIKDPVFTQFLILISTVCFFLLFLFTRLSYQNTFSVEKDVRLVIDLISTILYFCLGMVLVLSGRFEVYKISIILGCYTTIALIGSAYNANVVGLYAVIYAFVCGMLICILGLLFSGLTLLNFPFVMTLFFYMILSFWHLRSMGEHRFGKYMTPVIFVIMALIIVLS